MSLCHIRHQILRHIATLPCAICDSPTPLPLFNIALPGICSNCLPELLNPDQEKRCLHCGAREHKGYCRICILEPPQFDFFIPAFSYKALARDIIRKIKYSRRFHLALVFARLAAEHMSSSVVTGATDLIVPVPSSSGHLRERGFSLPAVVARELSRTTGIPHAALALRSPEVETRNDIRSTLSERVFRKLSFPSTRVDVCAKNILLVDDVVTSGKTILAAASRLRADGASQVGVLALAISPHYEFNRLLISAARLATTDIVWRGPG